MVHVFPVLERQRQVELWSSLAGQLSRLVIFSFSGRLCLLLPWLVHILLHLSPLKPSPAFPESAVDQILLLQKHGRVQLLTRGMQAVVVQSR